MVNMREAVIRALRRDPEMVGKFTRSLRGKVEEGDGALARVVDAAEALEPIIAEAVERSPSRLNKLGLHSAQLLAALAADDQRSNRRLAKIAQGPHVGIVFLDVAGFTAFTARQGDQAAIELLTYIESIIRKKVTVANGELVKKLGDGFLLAFPSASQAVRGALAVCKELVRPGPPGDKSVQVRIAVHAGEPSIEADDLLGHDVNLTARLLDHCRPGEVIVSEAAKELAEKRLRKATFVEPRSVKIRGLAARVKVYSATTVPKAMQTTA